MKYSASVLLFLHFSVAFGQQAQTPLEEFITSVEASKNVGYRGSCYKRVSTKVTIRNKYGNPIDFYFIGTNHESSEEQITDELDFIKSNIDKAQADGINNLLVEQGNGISDNSLIYALVTYTYSQAFRENNAGLIDEFASQIESQPRDDMAYSEYYSKGLGFKSQNFDLVLNRNAPFWLHEKKYSKDFITMAVALTFRGRLAIEVSYIPEFLTTAYGDSVNALIDIEKLNALVASYQQNAIESLVDYSKTYRNSLREEFMAEMILNSSNKAIVHAHTGHITEVLKRIKPYVLNFNEEAATIKVVQSLKRHKCR